MTVKIVNLKPQKLTIPISFIVAGKNGKIIDRVLANKTSRRLRAVGTKHYRNVLRQVGNTLAKPNILGGTHGGHRIIPVKDGEKKNRRIRTTKWHDLTKKYVGAAPKSTRVWRKNSRRKKRKNLLAVYNSGIHIDKKKVSVKRSGIKKASRKDTVRISFNMKFTKLSNEVVNRLIAAPFVYGNERLSHGFIPSKKVNRGSSELLYFPEKAKRLDRNKHITGKKTWPVNRPFVSRLSGTLGKHMHTAIRKL